MGGASEQRETARVEASEQADGESQPAGHFYQIRVVGHLNSRWSGWFDGFAISQEEDGTTVLTGTVADQPALHGLILRIRDLGMPLLTVQRVGKEEGSWSG